MLLRDMDLLSTLEIAQILDLTEDVREDASASARLPSATEIGSISGLQSGSEEDEDKMEPHERAAKCREVFSPRSEYLNLELPSDARQELRLTWPDARRASSSPKASARRWNSSVYQPAELPGAAWEQRAQAVARRLPTNAWSPTEHIVVNKHRPCCRRWTGAWHHSVYQKAVISAAVGDIRISHDGRP